MNDKLLFTLDTNILIYAIDKDAREKHEIAAQILKQSVASNCLLMLQVLSEFYSAATRKGYVSPQRVIEIIEDLMSLLPVAATTGTSFKKALFVAEKYKMQFWDAMIFSTAKENRCSLIITEDFQHQQLVEGVQFFNPFKEKGWESFLENYLIPAVSISSSKVI